LRLSFNIGASRRAHASTMLENDLSRRPPSLHAVELQRGTISLRFPQSLEIEFRQSHLERVRSRVRVWQTSLLVLGIAALVVDIVIRGGVEFSIATGPQVLVLMLACAAIAAVSWSKQYGRAYLRIALVGHLMIAVLLSWLVARTIHDGRPEGLAFLTTNVMGVFFLSGLLIFDACLVNLLALFSFVLAGTALGLPLPALMYDTAMLATVIAVGALTMFGIEQTNRRFFLERCVLGDLAERDGLTGLRNRRAFDEQLMRVWQQSLRDRGSMAVLMIDLDYFKDYNDAYGHQSGDACLTQVARMVQRHARRPLDIAARYGGEELAMVLYQSTGDQALLVAEQIRDSIEKMRIEHRASAARGLVTVSIGVCSADITLDRTPEMLLQQADEALYAAKLAGRNAVRYRGPDHVREFSGEARRLMPGS
jgi:diguanylate cyclase (GGDEF)-like protein